MQSPDAPQALECPTQFDSDRAAIRMDDAADRADRRARGSRDADQDQQVRHYEFDLPHQPGAGSVGRAADADLSGVYAFVVHEQVERMEREGWDLVCPLLPPHGVHAVLMKFREALT